MMSTSVKMNGEVKKLLDVLQAKLVISGTRKVSQQELLEAMVRFSAEREDELVRYLAGINLPMEASRVARIMKLPKSWGIRTREEEIDTALYGRKES